MAVSRTTLKVMSDLITPHLTWCRAQGFSKRTIEDRGRILRRADNDLPFGLNQATTDELSDWIAAYRTNQTKATYHGHLAGYFDWADGRHLDWNPMSSLPRPKVASQAPRPVTNAELRYLLDNAREPFRLWVILAAGAGLRAMEIAALQRRDVTEQTITVVCGKGGKTSVLPTHPLIWAEVRHLPAGPVTRNALGQSFTARFISSRFGWYCRRRLGLDGITLHRFRHWFGTEALRQSRNARVAQELLRHDSLTSTQIYTKVTDEERSTCVNALPVLGAPTSA